MIGMISLFAMPAAALDIGDNGEDTAAEVEIDGNVDGEDPGLDILASILGGDVIELDCSFSEDAFDEPEEVCSLTIAGEELPPENGFPPEL